MRDVIVVGAGPAGNNIAYKLSGMGYSVTVIDRRNHVGDKLCTGIVGRACIEQFPIDRSLVHKDARYARVTAPGGKCVDFISQDVQAHVIDRVRYVSSFADKARRAGAEYLLGYRVTEVSTDGDWARVHITDDAEKRTLESKSLVIASGFGSELTGQLGLGKVGDFVTGVQAEVTAPDLDGIQMYLGRDIAPGFFAWLVPTSEGKALAGLLSRHHAQTHLERFLLKLKAEGRVKSVVKEPAKWGIPLRPLGRTFGERLLVVGDAAGQVKPTTGGGIYYALLASEVAAEALHRGLLRNDLSAKELGSYEKGWKSLLSREMEIGYSARRVFEVLRDRQIDFLMDGIATNGIYKELVESGGASFDWHGEVIRKVMGHPVVGKTVTLANPFLATLASRS